MQQMQGMLGQGMGAAQQLPQGLQGAFQGPMGQGQQMLDKLMQAAQGMGDGSGNVAVTPRNTGRDALRSGHRKRFGFFWRR